MKQRIIKFRARHIVTGEWLYGSYFNDGGEEYILPTNMLDIDSYQSYQVDGNTVGQFTGLQDKNGRDIYDGDILKIDEYCNQSFHLLDADKTERKEIYNTFSVEELKGHLERTYVTPVCYETGAFCVSSYHPGDEGAMDTLISCLFVDMKRCSPIFEFELVGNVYENPDVKLGRMFTAEGYL